MTDHAQSAPNYQFRVVARFQSALMRQVTEAVLIRRQGEGTVLNSKGVFNRCSLPRLTVEGAGTKEDKDSEEEGGGLELEFDKGEEITGSDTFHKKRFRPPNERVCKPRKRIKIDKKTTKEDNPRLEGLFKRKWPLLEFENECKKIRPNFTPELELEFGNEEQPKLHLKVQQGPEVETVKPSRIMFSIFDLKARTKNPLKLIKKCQENSKTKSKPPGPIGKKSLTTNTSKPGEDIRKYFIRSEIQAVTAVVNMNTVPAVLASDSCQQLETNYIRAEVTQGVGGEIESKSRAGESELYWDPGLYKEGTEG